MNKLFIFLAGSLFLLQGCASQVAQDTPHPSAPITYVQGEFNQESLYDLLLAEIAGQRRQFPVALENYLSQAEKTKDPAVAERATRIAQYLRDPENRWFGISLRARTIVFNKHHVDQANLVDYEGLADAKWKGRLCLRTSSKVYNHSLVAMLINRHGVKRTEEFIRKWVDNLALPTHQSDYAVMESLEKGECDVGIVNSYYFGRYQKKNPDTALKLFWPAHKNNGVHVNISGAGITKHSKRKEAAQKFLEWLSTREAQQLLASLNMEYPVNPEVEPSPMVKDWGEFVADTNNISNAGRLQKYALRLMERAGYE